MKILVTPDRTQGGEQPPPGRNVREQMAYMYRGFAANRARFGDDRWVRSFLSMAEDLESDRPFYCQVWQLPGWLNDDPNARGEVCFEPDGTLRQVE